MTIQTQPPCSSNPPQLWTSYYLAREEIPSCARVCQSPTECTRHTRILISVNQTEDVKEYFFPRLMPCKACWDALRAWHTQPHLPLLLSRKLHRSLALSWPTLVCLISLWNWARLPIAWQEESFLKLRGEEVERASPQRLNKCINFGGSPRAHAYVAEGGEGGSTVKLVSQSLNALP